MTIAPADRHPICTRPRCGAIRASFAAPARDRRPAFSLMELVVVMAIIAMLAAVALPRFGSSLTLQKADAAARRITADLTLARRNAMATSTPRTILLTTGANATYELVGMKHPDFQTRAYIVYLADDCYGAELVSYDFGGDKELKFDMYGVPDSGARLTLRVGDSVRRIDVDADTGVTRWTE